jgi:RecB family endonuclease NucS
MSRMDAAQTLIGTGLNKMPIFEINQDKFDRLQPTTFSSQGVRERGDLQRLLRDQVEIVAPDVLIVSEEFGEWEDSKRRIDLLGIDRDADLVVVELKRTEDGGHMELQAIRYAAMVSKMTFERLSEVFARYLAARGRKEDARRLSSTFSVGKSPMENSSHKTCASCWRLRNFRANSPVPSCG